MPGPPSRHFQNIASSAPLDKISCGLKALSRPRSRYSRGGGISLGVPASWDGSCGGDGRRGGGEIILPRGGGRRGGGETIPRGCGGYAAVGDDERAIFFCLGGYLGGISFNSHATIIFVFGTVLRFKNCFHVGRRGGGETIPRGGGGYAAVGDDERAIFFCLGGISFNPHAIIFVFGTVLSFKNCFHVHTRFFIAVSFFSAVGFFYCVASLVLDALASRRPQRPVDSWSVRACILRC